MDKKFSEYAKAIVEYLSASFPYVVHGTSDDMEVLRKWFRMRIPEHHIISVFHEMAGSGRKVRMAEIDKVVVEKLRMYEESHFVDDNSYLKFLEVSMRRIILDVDASGIQLLEELKECFEETDVLLREKKLIELESRFYGFLFKSSPHGRDCLKEATALVSNFKGYWDSHVYRKTVKALVKKCLRERYAVPEFTSVRVY